MTFGLTRTCILSVLVVALLATVAMAAPPLVRIGNFSEASPTGSLPPGWKEIRFGENDASTQYRLVEGDSAVVVRARSSNGASGLITREEIRLTDHPILEWRWKVDGVVDDGDVTEKETDDAPARVYVTFDYTDLGVLDRLKLMLLRRFGYAEAPSRALNYVWANHRDLGTTESPYTDQIVMIPVEAGPTKAGRWVRERRNVLDDYRAVFGEDPPPVNGVAIMTDTDNTAGAARAWYGDIVFRAARAD